MSDKKLKTVIEVVDKYSKELKDFSKKINETNDELKKLQDNFGKGSDGAKKLSDSLGMIKKVGVAAAVLYVGNKIKDLGKFAIESASKMDELANVTRQVFESSTKEIEQWAKTIDREVGRSIYQMQNFASVYGSMFKGAGFDTSFFKQISKDLATFTADFSSFFNVTDDEAFTAIKGALTGETEALKRYGLILNDTTMAEYALAQGIKEKWQNLDTATKMQLRYNKLMEMTTYIQGDASRTIDGYANSLKKAEGLIDNIATAMGQKLLPFATKVVHMFNGIAEAVDDMLSKKSSTDYLFDFAMEKQNLEDLKDRYVELSKMYLEGLGTPESERERNELYQKLLAMYPDLIGAIGNEANKYLEVASAIDKVIGKLKEKILAQAQDNFLSKQLEVAKKYEDTIVKAEAKYNEKNAEIMAKQKINADYLLNDNLMKELKGQKDEYSKKKLLKKRLEEAGVQKITSDMVNDFYRGYAEKSYITNLAKAQKETQESELKKLDKLQAEELKIIKNGLNTIETFNRGHNDRVTANNKNAVKSTVASIQEELNAHRKANEEKNESDRKTKEKATNLLIDWKNGKYNNANLKELKEIHKKIVASGIDPVAASEIQSKITQLESLEGKTEKTAKAIKTHSKSIVKSAEDIYNAFQKDFQNQINYDDIIGTSDTDKIKNQISILKRYIKEAVDNGNIDLAKSLQVQLQEKEFKIKKFDIDEALDKVQEKLENLELNFSKGKISEENYHEETTRILDETLKAYEKHGIDLDNFAEEDAKRIKETIEALKKKKKLSEEELNQIQNVTFKLKQVNQQLDNINMAASGFSQLGQATGSKSIGNIGSILGNVANLGSSISTLTGPATTTGSIASVSAAQGAAAAGAGLAAAGAIATGVGAAIGIAILAGSMMSSKAKKKTAAIDTKNKENENIYSEQTKAMQQLTQALMRNSEIIKSFSDRMLSDVSKNPTLKGILGGEKNFENLYTSIVNGKHFNDISALERGSTSVRKMFRKKHKDTYTAVTLSESKLLKHLGFEKTELDAFTDSEIRQLNEVLKNVSHQDLIKATGRDLTQSNIEEWKKQINEFVTHLNILDKEKKELFNGATLESLIGIDYISEKKLIEEYTEQFKQMGLVGEQYNATIKEMVKNNQVLVTAMQDVRAQTIEGLASGNGGFVTSMKSYFEKIFKNASSIAYDVAFSDLDSYFNEEFKKISEKLVNIKKSGKLDFNDLLTGVDFSKLKLAEGIETQAKKSIDTIKQFLLSRGVDISIINKILPNSDFNDKLNDMKNALSSAMNDAQKEKKFDSFTKSLGESLYESTKASLIKAFSESSVYQGLISKFINTKDMKSEIEKVGTFEGAFNIIKNKLKDFGYRLESNGLGGFDAINNKDNANNQLGNAYYQDKSSNIEIKVTNNFYEKVYGVDDLDGRILKGVNKGIELWTKKPKVTP
jgi:hypothetical protein